jgi:hypothetical protein
LIQIFSLRLICGAESALSSTPNTISEGTWGRMSVLFAVAGRKLPKTAVPLLAAVFMITWGMFTLLIVLQDRMSDAQSDLIHTLFNQSVSRVGAKSARAGDHVAASRGRGGKQLRAHQDQSSAAEVPSPVQVPSSVPLNENASSQTPSSQVKPKAAEKPGRNSRKMRSPFSRPPAEITDPSDMRRVSISI